MIHEPELVELEVAEPRRRSLKNCSVHQFKQRRCGWITTTRFSFFSFFIKSCLRGDVRGNRINWGIGKGPTNLKHSNCAVCTDPFLLFMGIVYNDLRWKTSPITELLLLQILLLLFLLLYKYFCCYFYYFEAKPTLEYMRRRMRCWTLQEIK